MEDIETRLRDTSDACLKAYAVWHKSKRDAAARETMADAVHELRKVCARLEIELGASEREELAQRPIPVPPHRAAQRRQHDDGLPSFITGGQNGDDEDEGGQQPQRRQQQRGPQRQQYKPQNQEQQQDASAAPAGKTVTLERRFGRGRPAAANAEAADKTDAE